MLPFDTPMSPAQVPATVRAALLVVITTFVVTACSQGASQQGSQQTSKKATAPTSSQQIVRHSSSSCTPASGVGGANAQAIPTAFPKDFPIYPGATFAAATQSTATRVTVTWMSVAAASAVRDYYEKQLQSGDWQLFGEQYSDPCMAYWHVERRSDTHFGGTLTAYAEPGAAGSSFISADLDKK
jgi:hypothetical protein